MFVDELSSLNVFQYHIYTIILSLTVLILSAGQDPKETDAKLTILQ